MKSEIRVIIAEITGAQKTNGKEEKE